jgi:hypothetical protein
MQSMHAGNIIPLQDSGQLNFGGATLCIGLFVALTFSAVSAKAQTSATLRGPAPPAVIGNVWNGMDHQPTAASDPPLDTSVQQTIDRTLEALDKQLLQFKLPESPS